MASSLGASVMPRERQLREEPRLSSSSIDLQAMQRSQSDCTTSIHDDRTMSLPGCVAAGWRACQNCHPSGTLRRLASPRLCQLSQEELDGGVDRAPPVLARESRDRSGNRGIASVVRCSNSAEFGSTPVARQAGLYRTSSIRNPPGDVRRRSAACDLWDVASGMLMIV